MHVASEETFGPIAALFKFLAEDEVIYQANKCDVGLACYVMTSDLVRSHRVREIGVLAWLPSTPESFLTHPHRKLRPLLLCLGAY